MFVVSTAQPRRVIVLLVLLVAALSLVRIAIAAQTSSEPRELSLVVEYRAALENRVAFTRQMTLVHAPRLQQLQSDGVLEAYQLFLNRYADEGTWDALVLLTFADANGLRRWHEIERSAPGGLDESAAKLVSSVHTAQVDLFKSGAASALPLGNSAFLVIPYDYLVAESEYKKYLEGYTFPQMEGWIEEQVLQSYRMFLTRYPAGRKWTALLILEYKNDAALDQRRAVIAKVRERLARVPSWKAISDNKQSIREEGQVVVADQVAP